jgi:hypothetical protein
MDAADNPFGVIFADGKRCHAESDHAGEPDFRKQAAAPMVIPIEPRKSWRPTRSAMVNPAS